MKPGHDVLSWLLPGADERRRMHARRVVTALRLLRDDARPAGAESIGLALDAARAELERVERVRAALALEGLLHAQLTSALPGDSFLDPGPAPLAHEQALALLLRAREEGVLGLAPPAPGESPLAACRRLLEALAELGLPRERHERWIALVEHVALGPAAAERRWTALLERARAELHPPARLVPLLAGLVAARLDRLDPRGALGLLRDNQVLALVDPELRRLFAFAALLAGELELARGLHPGGAARRLPLGLVELREACEAGSPWATLLAGRAAAGPLPVAATIEDRRELGAVLLGVFALAPGGELVPLALDVASSARPQALRRLAERDGVWRSTGEPEQRLCATAGPVTLRCLEGGNPRGALARTARALALAPVLDREGEAAGWLRIESEHLALPSRQRLAALAGAWWPEVLAAHRPSCAAVRGVWEPRPPGASPIEPDDPLAQAFARWLATHSLGLARRRAFLVQVFRDRTGVSGSGAEIGRGEFEVLLERGGALADWRERAGGARALRRSARTASAVLFGEPDASLALHAASQSGLVLPLPAPARHDPHGLYLVLESNRRRDFLAADQDRLERALRSFAPAARAALFAAWHRSRFGPEICWDPGSSWLGQHERVFHAAAGSRSPLFLSGPRGAGRRTLARWLHFAGGEADRPCLEGGERAPAEGSWIVELEALSSQTQIDLARLLERGSEARVLLLSRAPLGAALERGLLRGELARHFAQAELTVPALCERRDEIPGLCGALAASHAREEGRRAPVLRDEALALLWRQPWPGNVSELGALVYRIVLCQRGAEVGEEEVRSLARSLGLEPCKRLPPRRARARDVELALLSTRHGNGTWNRTRAARYLGWDPDTLEARIGSLGLVEPAPEGGDGPGFLPRL